MKVNTMRILCLILVILLSVAVFSGCKAKSGEETSSTEESQNVTSVAPPSIVTVTSEGYAIAEGTTIVTIVKDTATDVTTMKVATDTTLAAFKQAVTANEGYSYKITDASDVEITDDTAIIADGYKFTLYKDGETEAIATYTISVVSQEEIASTISEVKKEEERYESELAAASSQAAANSNGNNNPGTTSGTRSETGVSSTDVSSKIYESSPITGYTFQFKTDNTDINVSTEVNDRFHVNVNNMVNKYGVDFVVDPDAGAVTANALVTAVMAGEKYADVVVTQLNAARSMAKSQALADFRTASNIDFNASYYNTAVTSGLTFQGKTYALSFTSMGTNPMGVTFNKDLVSLYAPEYDIYAMYKNGTWTADAYTALMAKCTKNLDSNPATNEIYGMTSNTNVIGIALSSFSGATTAKDPSTGYIYPCFITDAGIQSLEWCKNAYKNNYWKYNADIFEAISYFAAGNAATVVTYMWAVTQAAASADFEMGFVPFPKAGNQSNYVTQTYDCQVFVVPKTNAANIDKVGFVLGQLAADNDANINTNVKNYENVGLDSTGCGIYRWAVTNTTPDLSGGVYSSSIDSAIGTCVTNSSKEPASAMAAIRDQSIAETYDYYGALTGQPSTWFPS